MSTAKLKVTVSCGGVKEEMYFRTSFFNNGIPLRNQFPIINRVFQKLVKPGYQVRVSRGCVDYPIGGWHNLDSVFVWLPTVRLHKTVCETVITKPACIEYSSQLVVMPEGIKAKEVWINQYGEYEGFAFIRVESKHEFLKPIMSELRDYLAAKLKCKVGIGVNNTLWVSPYQRKFSELCKSPSGKIVSFKETIHHPAECQTVRHIVEL
jgi:hypothetical protein